MALLDPRQTGIPLTPINHGFAKIGYDAGKQKKWRVSPTVAAG